MRARITKPSEYLLKGIPQRGYLNFILLLFVNTLTCRNCFY